MKAIRSTRFFLLLSFLTAMLSAAFVAGLPVNAAPVATHGSTGQALALRASLRALASLTAHPKTFKELGVPQDLRRASDGRYIYSKAGLMRAGALLKPNATNASIQVDEPVQTFDVFNPPPTFIPTQGPNLTPTNLTPVWTADETMIVFSSNRTATGAAGSRFHIWAVPVNGGAPVQLTDSTAATGELSTIPHGEFFPALSANNNQFLAFTSDANSANVQNLYVMGFQATTVSLSTLTSPTIRGNDSSGFPLTGFSGVTRPTFSPSNSDEILFAATSVTGANAGHSHLYFLFATTKGFNPTVTSFPAKITDGTADDQDPSYSEDGLAIAFASNASVLSATGQAAGSDPNTSLLTTSNAGANRNLFVIGGGGALGFATVQNGGQPVTATGTDNFGPAWSSRRLSTYLNPTTGEEYLAFSRSTNGPTAPHDIYYVKVLTQNSAGTESLVTETATNAAVKLNTDDPGNVYDDRYPSWSPFLTDFSITYSSNRSVSYNQPSTGAASETAISIPQNGSLGNGAVVGAAYMGILESQVLNLDPPSFLPYSGNELVHIGDASGNTTRYGITPGQPVTITVRLSDREAGIDDTGGPNGGPRVYVQIKDPDSKYQDAQGLEHKVFAKDTAYRTQANVDKTTVDSGTSAFLMNGGGYPAFNQFTNSNGLLFYPINRGSVAGIEGPEAYLSGTGLTSTTAPLTDTLIGTISIGRTGGGTNPDPVTTNTGGVVTDPDFKQVISHPPGDNPDLFIPWGPEYECQVVNPQFANGGNVNSPLDTSPLDYRTPFYLAGVDDQLPFSGQGQDRPVVNGKDAGGAFVPAEWLQLQRSAAQDGQGGVLYTVKWTTPTSGSDYYLDVIAFDKAVPPPVSTSGNGGSNWRIYDNVWGFSTAASIGSNDILVVNDYALGQKFAATTFGGLRGLVNLVPKLYGAESYVTDIDVNVLPNAIYRHSIITGADINAPSREVLKLGGAYSRTGLSFGLLGFSQAGSVGVNPVFNGLGVGSYDDEFIDDGTTQDGVPAVRSQQYSIWRILSRGPVPASVYASYEPSFQNQPAVVDAGTTPVVNIAAARVPVANRCIFWLSPFTGDVLAGPGTLLDSATQNSLRAFVKAGGRLCVSGQDVGSALTQGGTINNTAGGFLPDVLNAKLATTGAGTHLPASGTNPADIRISFTPGFDAHLLGNFEELTTDPAILYTPTALSQRLIRISNNYGGNIFERIYVPDLRNLGNWRTDGSLDQLGPYVQPFSVTSGTPDASSVLGQIDTITPGTGAHTDLTLAPFTNVIPIVQFGNVDAATSPGGIGLIYTETPLTAAGGGSKVVYATFGLEALSSEFYRRVVANPKPNFDVYLPRNVRQGIIHNIVNYLRTGAIQGTVRATSGNGNAGGGIAGATVYLQSAFGSAFPAIPGRGTFSATTDANGNYRIDGVEPGDYTIVAYAGGYNRTASNPGAVFTVEGDTLLNANLTMSQAPPGSVTGTVTDSSNNPVPGATVSFTIGTGQPYTATTDVNGVYTLQSIPAGTYVGTASKPGFGAATSAPTAVTSNATVTVNFTLVPGPGSATGQVTDTSGNPIQGATVYFNTGSSTTAPITATTDANGNYSIASITAGAYNVTATAPGFGASTPIQVVIVGGATTTVPVIQLGPVVNGTLGGLVTGTGSTTPLAGVTLSIVNTVTGVAVTPSPVTTSTATTASDGGQINYGPITLPTGTYTVTATSTGGTSAGTQTVTIAANAFSRVDFTGINGVPALHTFSAGLNFLSLPFNYTGTTFDTLFGALNTAPAGTTPNGNRSHVAVWNPLVGQYALDPTSPADAIRLGVGYWVFLKTPVVLTQAGTVPTGSVSVALHPAWNQIGVPSTSGVAVSSLTFNANGAVLTFAQAVSPQFHVVSPTLYRFDGAAYQAVSSTDTLQPYQAYWIKVYVDTTLLIPTGK